jgi:hypothetical protein
MTVSATNRGLKPGVCTSTARPANPFIGMMIFETDTNRLGVWTGSEWKFFIDVDTPPALELIKTQTIGTAVSSVEVTGAFSSTYDNYKIIVSGGVIGGGADMQLQLGSTTSGYYMGSPYTTFAGTTTGLATANGSNFPRVGFGSTTDASANIELMNPFLSRRTGIRCMWGRDETNGLGGFSSGFLDNTTSYTSFTLTNNFSATFTGGTIRVYGYRNS